MTVPPMVNVIWIDTNECSLSTWQTKEELLDSKLCIIDSLGYLMEETNDYVIISGDKDHENSDDQYGRSQIIPKGVVKEIQYLTLK